MPEQIKDAAEQIQQKVSGDGASSLASKLAVPVAAGLGTLVSRYAAKKVPELVRDHLLPGIESKGGDEARDLGKRAASGARDALGESGGLAGKAASKLLGGGGDDGDEKQPARGWGRGRRLPVQCSIDVAVPVETAYAQWTQFEELPRFMFRAEQVEQRSDDTLVWHENIWGIRRSWESKVVEQVPNERIVWHSESRGGHSGVLTFHPLADRLTRIELNIDFQPDGLFEKMSSGLRFHRRAVGTDLRRFKAFVEMRNQETGSWDGEIHDEEENPARDDSDGGDEDGGSRGEKRDDRDDEERSREREERERRREERRKAVSGRR
jgi:uncharacterized membrane protein